MEIVGRFPTVVVGSGIAGLTHALGASRHGDVLIITKKSRADSNTNWAQGGIAAVTDEGDTFESHIADTLEAGAGLCRTDAVEAIIRHGPETVEDLIRAGADFAREEGRFELGIEGGHRHRRIIHAKDRTGHEIERALLGAVAANPRIQVWEHGFVLDLWVPETSGQARRCTGVIFLDSVSGAVGLVRAGQTMLATGGCGKVYRYTTNPDIATADGVAMAARAGCTVVNLEMVQFHPTCLFHPRAKSFLISEAVRGEGAVLRTRSGEAFMEGRHPLASLAPRDVVAREIDREMKARGDPYVHLDVTPIGEEPFLRRFPTISEALRGYGIVPGVDPIPVVPAAHYMCGGVRIDLDGRTDIEGLLAAGEVAHTGVHGANRLASNSLLEAHVIATRAAVAEPPAPEGAPPGPRAGLPGRTPPGPDHAIVLEHEWDEVRRLMWDYVGLVRSVDRLEMARDRLALMREAADRLYARSTPDTDLAEIRNITLVGSLIVASALARKESRGLHQIVDFPGTMDRPLETWCRWGRDEPVVVMTPLTEP